MVLSRLVGSNEAPVSLILSIGYEGDLFVRSRSLETGLGDIVRACVISSSML